MIQILSRSEWLTMHLGKGAGLVVLGTLVSVLQPGGTRRRAVLR